MAWLDIPSLERAPSTERVSGCTTLFTADEPFTLPQRQLGHLHQKVEKVKMFRREQGVAQTVKEQHEYTTVCGTVRHV